MQGEEVYSVRRITEEDFALITKWCKDWKFPDIVSNLRALPERGYIASCDSIDVFCGFLYLTDSLFAHPEWIISNKEVKDKDKRKQALKLLFAKMEEEAKELGHSIFLMSVKHPLLLKSLKEVGFEQTDKNMTNLIKIL
jgi:hypothetical protein